MDEVETSDRDARGEIRVLPNGQHRWVPHASDVQQGASPTPMEYTSPERKVEPWWACAIAFVFGLPSGAVAIAAAIAGLWQIASKSTPAPAMFATVIASAIGGAFALKCHRRFLGWLAFGTSLGLLATSLLALMFWGWRDC
jgi:hypothetical protein